MDHPVRRKRAKSPESTRLDAADWVSRGLEVLAERGRRALRVHLSSDVATGLAALEAAVKEALA